MVRSGGLVRSLAVVLVSVPLLLLHRAAGADIQDLYPDHNVSTKYYVEFRARSGFPGHAFVYIGRELDNGLSVVEAIAGFYPSSDDSKRQALKNIAHGPGVVTATLSDLSSTVSFRVHTTPGVINEVLQAIETFNDQDYDLLANNCVDLAAKAAGLVGIRTARTSIFPYAAMLEFKKSNDVRIAIENGIASRREHAGALGLEIQSFEASRIAARRREAELFEQHLAAEEALRQADQANQNEIARLTEELNRITRLQTEAQQRLMEGLREIERLRQQRESLTIEMQRMEIEAGRWQKNEDFDAVRLGIP